LEDQDEKAGGAPSKSVSMIRESVLKDQSQVTFPEIEIEDKVYIEKAFCVYMNRFCSLILVERSLIYLCYIKLLIENLEWKLLPL
jgi:hypothetical protein